MDTIVTIDDDEPGVKMTYIMQSGESTGDAGDQYTGLDRFGRVVDSRWINSSVTDINRIQYGYDEASNRIWRQNPVAGTGQDEFYTYDGLYQLEDLQRGTLNEDQTGISGTPTWEEDFEYDSTGNWTNYTNKISGSTNLDQDRDHNTVNEITALGGSSSLFGYDAAGNMTTAPQPSGWSSAYTLIYDAWDRLVQVKSGGTVVATYAYDGQNRRTEKIIGSLTRHYYYSSQWQILEERRDTSVSADRQFVWGLRGVNDLVLRDLFTGGFERRYALADALSITAITDTGGSVQERYGYDAFGVTNFMNASFDSESSSANGWETLFCGYRWDAETGFYQVQNRYLHSPLGSWLSRDPIKEQGGLNLYCYVLNRPIINSDPTGLSGPGSPGPGAPLPPGTGGGNGGGGDSGGGGGLVVPGGSYIVQSGADTGPSSYLVDPSQSNDQSDDSSSDTTNKGAGTLTQTLGASVTGAIPGVELGASGGITVDKVGDSALTISVFAGGNAGTPGLAVQGFSTISTNGVSPFGIDAAGYGTFNVGPLSYTQSTEGEATVAVGEGTDVGVSGGTAITLTIPLPALPNIPVAPPNTGGYGGGDDVETQAFPIQQ